jgi:hypothetical protein
VRGCRASSILYNTQPATHSSLDLDRGGGRKYDLSSFGSGAVISMLSFRWQTIQIKNNMNDTPKSSPRPKAKKNKIRPKLKPIVSPNEDDDEGLGYGEWAPVSPLKPRNVTENNWSGSEEDEKKEEISSVHEALVARDEVKKIRPKLQPVSSEKEVQTKEEIWSESRSRPESQCSFDNKLQLSESNMDVEKVKSSDNKASTNTQHTVNSNKENISDETRQRLRARISKGLMVLLCVAVSCEVLSIAIITKVRMSHVELSSIVNETWVSDNAPIIPAALEQTEADEVLSSSKEDNEEVPNMELTEIKEDETEPKIESMLSSEEAILPVTSIVNDEQYDAKDEESESEVNELPEIMEQLEVDAEVEGLSQSEEVHEGFVNDDGQSNAKDEESESGVNEETSVSNKLEAEEYLSPSEQVTESETVQIVSVTSDEALDANRTPDLSDEGLGDEPDANDLTDIDLVEVAVEDSENGTQPEPELVITPSEEATEEYVSTSVEEDKQPVANDNNDASTPAEEPESVENEHAKIELIETETTLEDGSEQHEPEGSPSLDDTYHGDQATEVFGRESTSMEEGKQPVANDNNDASTPAEEPELVENEHPKIDLIETETTLEDGSEQHEPEGSPSLDDTYHGDNNDHEENDHELQQESPRTTETKREFLAKLDEFEDAFESYEVVDALIGHVACAVPKLLLKRILGVAMKVKGRFSKKK